MLRFQAMLVWDVRCSLLVGVVAGFSLLVSGCGGSTSPSVAHVTTATSSTTAAGTNAAGAMQSDVGPGSSGEGSPAARGGNHVAISFGNAAETAKFSACIRAHGVPSFPDPNSQGTIQFGPAQGIDPNSAKFRSARTACAKLLPNGGRPTAAQQAQTQQKWLAFSRCMRAHGITDFPDPSDGGPPNIQPGGDLNPNNPRFQAAENACKAHLSDVLGGDKFLHSGSG